MIVALALIVAALPCEEKLSYGDVWSNRLTEDDRIALASGKYLEMARQGDDVRIYTYLSKDGKFASVPAGTTLKDHPFQWANDVKKTLTARPWEKDDRLRANRVSAALAKNTSEANRISVFDMDVPPERNGGAPYVVEISDRTWSTFYFFSADNVLLREVKVVRGV